ncbi:MAG: hypothetical protein SFV21_06650 [Rhodospirillaceae bacterium]|nr:hypothetical protein [Rhodospirillaceae bacterium]
MTSPRIGSQALRRRSVLAASGSLLLTARPASAQTAPATPKSAARKWDAVLAYAGANTQFLAPKVEEYKQPDPPFPFMKSRAELKAAGAWYTADLARTNALKFLVAQGKPDLFLGPNNPEIKDGFVIELPPGLYQVRSIDFGVKRGYGMNLGPRIILLGQIGPNGEHPVFQFTGSTTLSLPGSSGIEFDHCWTSLEVENIEVKSDSVALDGGPGEYLRYSYFENVAFTQGFKNAHGPHWYPGIHIYNNCVLVRAGHGDGLTHSFYSNYSQAVIVRNSLFGSTAGEGHCFKCYSSQLDMRGSTIANWWHAFEEEDGYYSEQVPLDIGGRAQTVIVGCHVLKRGNRVRNREVPFIDYRNRLWQPGFVDYHRPVDWGTTPESESYADVDNAVGTPAQADPPDQRLYRHVCLNNQFFNGILPDGSIDPWIKAGPGFGIRNDGTMYQWADGAGQLMSTNPSYHKRPADYQLRNEKSVVYMGRNRFLGVPLRRERLGPLDHEQDPGPIVDLPDVAPQWVATRLARSNGADHWWTTEWPSAIRPRA